MEKVSSTNYKVGSLREFAEWTKRVVRDPKAANGAPKKCDGSDARAELADAQIGAAAARGRIARATKPLAAAARYDRQLSRVIVDLSIPGLLAGIFGTRAYMARRAGQPTSPAKAAARANGAKGGRPHKAPRMADIEEGRRDSPRRPPNGGS